MLMFNLSKELMDFFVIFTSKVKFLKLRKCEEERGEEQINDQLFKTAYLNGRIKIISVHR